MPFHVPLLLDSSMEISGVFAMHTSEGPVVIIFGSPQRLREFVEAARPMVKAGGSSIGSFEMDQPTFEDVVAELIRMDPSMGGGTTTFIRDTDPYFESILTYLKSGQSDGI